MRKCTGAQDPCCIALNSTTHSIRLIVPAVINQLMHKNSLLCQLENISAELTRMRTWLTSPHTGAAAIRTPPRATSASSCTPDAKITSPTGVAGPAHLLNRGPQHTTHLTVFRGNLIDVSLGAPSSTPVPAPHCVASCSHFNTW